MCVQILDSTRGMLCLAGNKPPKFKKAKVPKNKTATETASSNLFTATEQRAFKMLVDDTWIDCRTDTSHHGGVRTMQTHLSDQGWCLLCVRLLSMENLHWIHLSALRLLHGLVGGGNIAVQRQFLRDMKVSCLN